MFIVSVYFDKKTYMEYPIWSPDKQNTTFTKSSSKNQLSRFWKLIQIEEWTSPLRSTHRDSKKTYIDCPIFESDKEITLLERFHYIPQKLAKQVFTA